MINKILKKKSQQNKKDGEKAYSYSSSCSESEGDPEFENYSDAEDFEDYKVDGYHPAYIGETFKDGRYKIIQKLGWGHFSTVWLTEDCSNNGKYVALKIQKSKQSYQESALDEIELLQDLKKMKKILNDKSLKIKIVDFGNACWTHKKFSSTIQTREYRAPEVILGIDYIQNTDVFSLACMIYELITNDYLFKPKKREGTSKSDEHLALMMECLGKFSKQFCLSGSKSREYFNKNGQLLRIKQLIDYPISEILIQEYNMDEQTAIDIEGFLLPMLNYNPKKRVSAKEALEHKWLCQE
ncbi:protein kinase domain protein [Ichthyophthirius multifiliis]|uniref:non-specific serine/threonine protein kinase n=1 Tax=Ichthyophthirius multifiliis TaxID=5932 RepID=G0QLG7_ICHMU|nr:protein kinase domain protein [Ichthyophthirius multifiliis]EGR33940.1 protein kinase domain protein [Ichthyophthirius multifiliis]|eukprot:XP_004039244.1 protein kinase domain protein [Ichthyophthirius multifiliis]